MFTQQSGRKGRRTALNALALTTTALLALTACSGVVSEPASSGKVYSFTLATGATAGTPNAAVQDWFIKNLETASDGRIVIERTATEALCKAAEVVDCLRDGRAQFGVTVPDYTPQYFPSTSIVGIPFIGQNSQAIMESLADLHQNNPAAKAAMTKIGLHFIATWPVGRMLIGSNTPLTQESDLSGLKLRASGPLVQQIFKGAGANIVAVTAPETYEAAQRGVIDSVGGAIDFPVNYKLMELLPYWTDPGIGQYSSFGMWFSNDAYNSLPDDLKKVVDKVAVELNTGAGIQAFNDAAAAQCKPMLDAPTVKDLTRWSDSATTAWQSSLGDSTQKAWLDLAAGQGLDSPQSVLDDYLAGLKKYAGAKYTDATSACVDTFTSR